MMASIRAEEMNAHNPGIRKAYAPFDCGIIPAGFLLDKPPIVSSELRCPNVGV